MKMINKDVVKKTLITILVLSVICLMYDLFRFAAVVVLSNGPDAPRNPTNFIDFSSSSGIYKIDVNTILKSIDSGQPSIFLPETAQTPNSNSSDKLEWKQSEHLKVAKSLFEYQWKESLSKNWSIYSMIFDRNCEENPVGFEYASFVFHRLIQGSDYEARLIEISLPDGTVSWGGDATYHQPLIEPSEHYLGDLKITADDALSIAEKNGGKAARQSTQNQCDLVVDFDVNRWTVVYYGSVVNNTSTLFEITISPNTGRKVFFHFP